MTSQVWNNGDVINVSWMQDVNTSTYLDRNSVFKYMATLAQINAITAGTGGASAVCATQLQAGMDAQAMNTLPMGAYLTDAALYIKNGTARTALRGEHRIRSILQPNATSLAAAPVNVNAQFIVQDNNAHFCLENMRLTAGLGYTGVGVYCQEGGGSDGTTQCLFSGVFRNLWIDYPTTNNGFLRGGMQNTVVDTMTAENMKGIFRFSGAGCGDIILKNFSLFNCFDQFILQTDDAQGTFETSVGTVHAYNHKRGRLVDVQNWKGGNFNDIFYEADAANLGDTGVFKFKDSVGLNISNVYALPRTGVPSCLTGIELDTVQGKFSQMQVTADIGLKLLGTGAHDLEFVNVDFTSCSTACMQFLTAFSGTIRTRGCKFNNAQFYNVVSQVGGGSYNWYSYDDEFLNAGLSGSAGSRNIAVVTSGEVKLFNPRIGRTSGSAAAAYFVEAGGTGTFDIYNPIWVGTPPSALTIGAQVINIHVTPVTQSVSVASATYTVGPSVRWIVTSTAGTTTLTLPSAAGFPGREVSVKNITAQTVVSASSNVVPRNSAVAGTAILPATLGSWALLVSDGVSWQIMASS